MQSGRKGGGIIALSFLIALMLTVFPLPDSWEAARPQWTLLVLLYWVLALPHRIGIFIAWLMGILMDLLTGTLLGIHALGFSVAAYIVLVFHLRIRLYPRLQQMLVLGLIVGIHLLLIFWIRNLAGPVVHQWHYWLPIVTSALVWPLIFWVLRSTRIYYKVS